MHGTADQIAVELWIVSGALLLGSVDLYKSVDGFTKGCYALTAGDTYHR
jgi:hypothetical protein